MLVFGEVGLLAMEDTWDYILLETTCRVSFVLHIPSLKF